MKRKLAPSRLKKKGFSKLTWTLILATGVAAVAIASAFGWIKRLDQAYLQAISVRAYQEPIIKEVEVIREVKIAKVTAYSCGGLQTNAEVDMNCPSLRKYPQGRTSTGTTPRANITVACDEANLGRTFQIEGIGQVKCEDTGSAIQGAGRFDLYVENVDQAYAYGVKYLEYYEVK